METRKHAPGADADTMGRTAAELLRWMLEVAEARDSDPKARTVNLKFTANTLRMWRDRVRDLPAYSTDTGVKSFGARTMKHSPLIALPAARSRYRIAQEACPHWDYDGFDCAPHACCSELERAERDYKRLARDSRRVTTRTEFQA